MDPQQIFCPKLECPARGQVGRGNIKIHSRQEKRCRCEECKQTFSIRKGTIFYRLRTDPAIVMIIITLLAYGCPLQAIVAAYRYDERTIKKWWQRAGAHCQQVHEHQVGGSRLDLGQVQADELKIKLQGTTIWMALAIMVSTRLWLGGAISPKRDMDLIKALVAQVRQIALCRSLLLAVDGLPSYVRAFQQAFRSKTPREGRPGRCHLRPWTEVAIVQVIKRRTAAHLEITRRIVQGTADQVTQLIRTTQGQGTINTAFIERLNATFRQRLAHLGRRTRVLARQPETLQAGMYVVGCLYNFCCYHRSLRISLALPNGRRRWLQRTPAIAAGLTDHRWGVRELFDFKVPPPRWTPPKRRGRHSKETLRLIQQWCN